MYEVLYSRQGSFDEILIILFQMLFNEYFILSINLVTRCHWHLKVLGMPNFLYEEVSPPHNAI